MALMKYYSIMFLMVALLASSVTASNFAFADVIAPKDQMDLNFAPEEVICKEKFVKIIRTSNGDAACVSPNVVDLLVKRGFALPPDADTTESKELQSKPIGTLTHMATTKQYKNPGSVETFPKIDTHNYVFKICAIDEKIRSPEVIITSDSETKSVKLRDVELTSCYTTATKVRASDSNSISAKLLNHGGISESITELENKISSLKSDIVIQREKLSAINEETPTNDRAKKVSAIHNKISDIRNELKNTRSELQKYLLFLNLNSATNNIPPVVKGKSITGIDVDGVLSEIISVNEALIQPDDRPENSMAYNVVFEICTDNTTLRIPVVELSSDIATKVVKMAEKVAHNTCQVSTGKIIALSSNSIAIKLAGQTQSSETIIELEKRIESIKDEMMVVQAQLNSASTSSSISKEERQLAISEGTDKSIELRKELNSVKVELHKILLEVYR